MNTPIMKYFLIAVGLAALFSSPLNAQAPRNTTKDVYQYLSWRSPFTANRHTEAPKVRNAAENLAITGFAQFPNGYFVTLTERDDPEKKHVIEPGVASAIEIIEVNHQAPSLTLKVKYLGSTAEIGFDPNAKKKKIAQSIKNQTLPASTAPRLVIPTPKSP